MSVVVITPPESEPVSLAEARSQARIDTTLEDPRLAGFILAAREMAEHQLQRSLLSKTYELSLDAFPCGSIVLPMGPIAEAGGTLTVSSVKYTDPNGVEQTLAASAYTVDGSSLIARIVPMDDWPDTQDIPNAVRIRYVSGHADGGRIPNSIKTWIVAHVSHLNENREATTAGEMKPLPFLDRLLDPYRPGI